MALMFSRVARNFIKNGYFPTDEATLSRILSAIEPASDRPVRIIDPCCGEGTALAELQHHLVEQGGEVQSFGIEYDEERAWHAKTLLDRCIHADLNDCNVALRQFSLLWLNPPYGDLVGDSERSMSGSNGGRKRLEKEFAKRCFPMVAPGGVLVLIVPYTVLDKEFAAIISRNFDNLSVHAAPEQRFRQAVILGTKRTRVTEPDKTAVHWLVETRDNRYRNADGEWVDGFVSQCVLPEQWNRAPYRVPPASEGREVAFNAVRVDPRQLADEITRNPVLWDRFGLLFRTGIETPRPPLRKLSDWHLALMLAAGQVSGVVESASGRVLLVKGDTYKTKSTRRETEVNHDTGAVTETRIATDRFVPLIRALDFTPNSPTFGRVIHIE